MALGIVLLVILLASCSGDFGDPFTFINKQQTVCETEAISLGSKLSDSYNSYDEATNARGRMKNDYIVESMGFIQNADNSAEKHRHKHITFEGVDEQSLVSLRSKGGWTIADGHARSLAPLEGKWIYMYGDLTLRHLMLTMLPSDKTDTSTAEAQHHQQTTPTCTNQFPHRTENVLQTLTDTGAFNESHSGPLIDHTVRHHHHSNHHKGKTCHYPGYGAMGQFTFDWKHYPWDEYAQWLTGEFGLLAANATRFPDVLVIQMGRSTCAHSMNQTKIRTALHLDTETRERHYKEIGAFFKALRTRINMAAAQEITVVVSTASRIVVGNDDADRCIWQINRIVAKSAHKHGFPVLEREEIEHRLLHKAEYSEDIRALAGVEVANSLYDAPSAPIVATALLRLVSCLKSGTPATTTATGTGAATATGTATAGHATAQ